MGEVEEVAGEPRSVRTSSIPGRIAIESDSMQPRILTARRPAHSVIAGGKE